MGHMMGENSLLSKSNSKDVNESTGGWIINTLNQLEDQFKTDLSPAEYKKLISAFKSFEKALKQVYKGKGMLGL